MFSFFGSGISDNENENRKRRRKDETGVDIFKTSIGTNDLEMVSDLLANDANEISSFQPAQQNVASGYPNSVQDCIDRFGVYGMYYILMLKEQATMQFQSGQISEEWRSNTLKAEVMSAVLPQFSIYHSTIADQMSDDSDSRKRKISETDCDEVWKQDPDYQGESRKQAKTKAEKQGTKRKRDEESKHYSNSDFFRIPPPNNRF